jgi:hypothetical protein
MSDRPQLLSGARGFIQRSNPATGALETIAFATDISVNTRVGVRATYVTGRMNAGAIDSLSYDVDVSIGRVMPMNDGIASNGLPPQLSNGQLPAVPAKATAIGAGLETIITAMTTSEGITLALYDGTTGTYVSSVRECRYAGKGMGLNAGDVGTERLNYVGIYDAGHGSEENNAVNTGYGV